MMSHCQWRKELQHCFQLVCTLVSSTVVVDDIVPLEGGEENILAVAAGRQLYFRKYLLYVVGYIHHPHSLLYNKFN